jgi:hypothetical protein
MKPQEAGFDGDKGINLNISSMVDGGIAKFRRSKTMKPEPNKYNFKNQLVWYYPDNEDAKLYYCNEDNQLFELDFIPVNQ